MSTPLHARTLPNLRNTRDLRAEMLSLAAELAADSQAEGQVRVIDSAITEATIRKEWDTLLPAIAPKVRARMALVIDETEATSVNKARSKENGLVPLDKPNYRFEVLRLLLGASLESDGPQPEAGMAAPVEGKQVGLAETLGASITPVRSALAALHDAGLIRSLRWLELAPQDLSMEQLSRLGALPQTLRFRFERGAGIKPPADLVKRVLPLLGPEGPPSWRSFALSGIPVAMQDVPVLDLTGTPRLDLVAHVDRDARTFDASLLRLLDDGLEFEQNMLAPAPVVVTLVRAGTRFVRDSGIGHTRCAYECDVFLSLLDMGLREQAIQYARGVQA